MFVQRLGLGARSTPDQGPTDLVGGQKLAGGGSAAGAWRHGAEACFAGREPTARLTAASGRACGGLAQSRSGPRSRAALAAGDLPLPAHDRACRRWVADSGWVEMEDGRRLRLLLGLLPVALGLGMAQELDGFS